MSTLSIDPEIQPRTSPELELTPENLSDRKHFGLDAKTIFFLGLLLAASGIVSPPVALACGILFGFMIAHPLARESHSLAKLLLQISVVALGFGMNLHQVIHAGAFGFSVHGGQHHLRDDAWAAAGARLPRRR